MKLGSTDITKIYLGNTEVSKAYLGDVQVHSSNGVVILDWIENTYKSAQIDTGFALNSANYVIKFKFSETQYDRSYSSLFITSGTSGQNAWRFANNGGARKYFWRSFSNTTSGNTPTNSALSNTVHTVTLTSSSCNIDGTSYTTTRQNGTANSNPLLLFEDNAAAGVFKLQEFDVQLNGSNVLSLRPARKNGVVGVYDSVSDTFIAPSTGTFTGG